ncbi:hypothetical protein DS745_06780 [Anaerobacillus alkaliphilus]|uniref:Uncharacterized protein n=1 Tax=Anaerobacillus alkaliphilus TaxID=1548597 RepID=A0A4Q0VV97_9BACI|nr:hypothetical protein [Anaerobacillus alkaliphilus]RXJ02403.1 hypothetical protein DS745_06780 [Anaerobacillus alkaliphilus]
MTIRTIVMILIASVIIVGCGKSDEHQYNGVTVKVDPHAVSYDFPPAVPGYAHAGDIKIEMVRGGYEWEANNQTIMSDAASPNQIAEWFEALELAPNSKVEIELEGQPSLEVFLWESDYREVEVPVKESEIQLPDTKGRYIYEVVANWSSFGKEKAKGRVSYTFVVEIQ